MNSVFKKMTGTLVLVFILGAGSLTCSFDTVDQLYGIADGSRSYHGATYDTVTGQEDNPFMFTTSPLGRALRATSFLLGYLYAGVEDSGIREHLMEDMDGFCEKVLNLYVLCHEAQRYVHRQLEENPDKAGYLLEELEHLRRRIFLLSENFAVLVGDLHSPEISTITVTLTTIAKKTGQMLAL